MTNSQPEHCPKCGTLRTGESCPSCGLVFARYRPGRLQGDIPSQLRELWAHVEANWADRAAHALFVEQGIRQGNLGYVVACYRVRQEDPMAREQLDQIVNRLMSTLTSGTDASVGRRPSAGRWTLYVMLFVLALLLAFLFLNLISR